MQGVELFVDGTKLVSLTFGVNLYTSRSFHDLRPEVLQTFALFKTRCPPGALTFYATETMKQHKPVTPRALRLLDTWLADGAPRKSYVALELKGADTARDAPIWKYETWSAEASSQSNLLSLALPPELPEEKLAFVRQLADIFPMRYGSAGFALECSRYDKEASETHAWTASMRHPGLDIIRLPVDARAAATGIKSVNWLTLLGHDLLASLGGIEAVRAQLSQAIELIECKHAVILRAGPAPAIGDVTRGDTLPLYREVAALVAPGLHRAAQDMMAFQLVHGFVARSQAWCLRHLVARK